MPPQSVNLWSAFENVIAQIYRLLGADSVKQNVSMSGHQIDIYVEEKTASGQVVKTAVECKYYKKNVGKDVVASYCIISDFLRKAGQIDKAVLVSYTGFTKEAFLTAKAMKVELITFADLEVKLAGNSPKGMGIIDEIIKQAETKPQPDVFQNEVFIVMSFSTELNDLYMYGIRGCIEKLGLTAVRADEMEYNGDIITEIIDHIKKAQYIVAEVSDRNPNVFYEVGWAHALNKQVILIAKEGTTVPFDLISMNHIFYDSIHHLEDMLSKRLKSLKDNNVI
ncbi:MAG: restriction endonuclease [bacterium]